jgi:uncharacterized protein (TIGR02453 family)
MSSFQGFSPEACAFFEELEKNNSRTYWDANKAVWESRVYQPMQAFLATFEGEFSPFHLFRQNRDVRFSKDKSPYRLWIGAISGEGKEGGVYGVRLGASGLSVVCGAYMMAKDQLERFRAAIDHEVYGTRFEEIVRTLAVADLQVGPGREAPLKTAPQGYAKDHPRVDFLRWKGAVVSKDFGAPEWLYTPLAVEKVKEVWYTAKPFKGWLDMYVGPSQEVPERAGRRSR